MEQQKINDAGIRLISIPEVCDLLNIGHCSVYAQINGRRLKTVKIGKRRLVRVKDLTEFIESLGQ